ncbi:MAG: hypothetical protein R6U96_01105 [Promethearchaeia archaeon]
MSDLGKAQGIVFLFNMEEGKPEDVSKEFKKYFSGVTENLVREGLMELVDLKKIIDEKKIYWGAVKKRFNEVIENGDKLGDLAWELFKKHTNIEADEDIRCLIYKGEDAPWNFTLCACVVYK